MFPHLVETAGFERALEVARFSEANIRLLRELAEKLPVKDREAAELRTLDSATAYEDQEDLDEAVKASRALNQKLPDSTIEYEFYGSRNASEELGFVPTVAGAVQQKRVAALWPYRLLTAVLAEMLTDFSSRFTIETHTPVLSIDHNQGDYCDYPYVVKTSRGSVRAREIVHCTNGHAAALIPGLVSKMYPLRGTMSTQRLGPSFARVGDKLSWSYMTPATYDPHTGQVALGLYYAQQNPYTGVMFVGGESQSLQGLLSGDDSVVGEDARRSLTAAPARIWKDAAPSEPLQVWSGIMGFTGDGLPLVGNLSEELTSRKGTGEWIAAGYNGHGMDKAWLCGFEVARMVLGEEDDEGSSMLPGLFQITQARVSSWTSKGAAETLANHVMMRE
jgi:glycine/D-amino acid oxidase-like deaminating enzyme